MPCSTSQRSSRRNQGYFLLQAHRCEYSFRQAQVAPRSVFRAVSPDEAYREGFGRDARKIGSRIHGQSQGMDRTIRMKPPSKPGSFCLLPTPTETAFSLHFTGAEPTIIVRFRNHHLRLLRFPDTNMVNLRESFSRMKRDIKRRLKGSKREADKTGTDGCGERSWPIEFHQ